MIYTVAVNPALDYYVYTDKFAVGEINKGIKTQIFAGGKALNVSTVLTRFGAENKALGFAAGFSGQKLLELLESEGIKYDFVLLKSGNTRINVKIREDKETDINMDGDIPTDGDIKELFSKLQEVKKGDIVCLCGSVQSRLGTHFYEKICETVKKNGADVAVDTTGDSLLNTLRFSPVLIKPNFDELCEIYGDKAREKDGIISCAKDLCKKGAQNVMVTLGGDGAVLVTKTGQILTESGIKGTAVSTVGAGDSSFAGFILKYKKSDIKDAFHFSMLCGAATAFKNGLCTVEDVEKIGNRL